MFSSRSTFVNGSSSRLECLKETVSWAREHSGFYATHLGDVRLDVSDERLLLDQLPILERTQIQAISRSPESPLACVDPSAFVRVHHTSGSTGEGSLWVFDTKDDWDEIVKCWSVALRQFGIQEDDRALVCAGYGRFIGFWGLHDAFVERGVMTVSGADADTKARVALIRALGITVVAMTPTYATRLGAAIANLDTDVRLILTSGEPRPLETRRRIEDLWGCEAYDTAGMTEMGTISMLECPAQPGHLHVLEDVFLEEVLDPVTREPVGYGEIGVRVVTTLARRGMPFIRYWTNDLVVRDPAQCECNLGEHVYVGGIRGRLDQMVKIDGVWFLPSMLEAVVRGFDRVLEYRATLSDSGANRSVLVVELELDDPRRVSDAFASEFAAECKRALGFRPRVDLVSDLPRFEVKAKRFHDQRASISA